MAAITIQYSTIPDNEHWLYHPKTAADLQNTLKFWVSVDLACLIVHQQKIYQIYD